MREQNALSTDELLDVLKALANPARLQIMEWLRRPEIEFAEYESIADRVAFGVCVSHIQAKSGLAQSTVSEYMNILERSGLVVSTRVGKWTHYKRNDDVLNLAGDAVARLSTSRNVVAAA